MAPLPKEIKKRLDSPEFKRNFIARYNKDFVLSPDNATYVTFLSQQLDLPPEEIRRLASMINQELFRIIRTKDNIQQDSNDSQIAIRVNTIANTLYLALYNKFGTKAGQYVYQTLESKIVHKLHDKTNDNTVQLIFTPITERNIDDVMNVFKELLENNDILKEVDCDDYLVLCAKSRYLPSSNGKGTKYCVERLKKIIDSVCRGESNETLH